MKLPRNTIKTREGMDGTYGIKYIKFLIMQERDIW
jgi:hypothetical protein